MSKLKFAKPKTINELETSKKTWKILISDDEPDVHVITKTVLANLNFDNRKLEFVSAFTGFETIELLKKDNDFAILLLDVVMETDNAGLNVVEQVRNIIKNRDIRIILRTGQPGSAPEREIITQYDINDYKEKTELTTTKLYTTIMTALRAFKDIKTIQQNEKYLENVIQSTKNISNQCFSTYSFSKQAMKEYLNLININDLEKTSSLNGFYITYENDEFKDCFCLGNFKNVKFDLNLYIDALNTTLKQNHSYSSLNEYVSILRCKDKIYLVYIQLEKKLTDNEKHILNLFSSNIEIILNNLFLTTEIIDSQKEVLETLSEIIEKRSSETHEHIHRISLLCKFLSKKYGLSQEDTRLIEITSTMHDVGKIAIPDSLLSKNSALTNDERILMQEHTVIGYKILSKSKKTILQKAAIIAYEHHEKWNGEGYPRGLKEEEIDIFARITSLADVFDALISKRVYKDSWSFEEAVEYIKNQRGESFEPKLVDIFLENIETIKSRLKL